MCTLLNEKQSILFAKQNWIKRKPQMILMKKALDFADCAPGPGVFVLFPPIARSLMCRAATQCQPNLDLEAPALTQSTKTKNKTQINTKSQRQHK
jgi:hypothetical protein